VKVIYVAHPLRKRMRKPPLSPGSDEARKAGCTCPVLDNNHGAGFGGLFVMFEDCPVHGQKAKAEAEEWIE
jgi:hypothetical protein